MALKKMLLATAAIPLIALMGMGSVSAAELIRPVVPAEAQSLVIKVQATDDELLQQQKKKERRENRQKKQDAAAQDDQNNGSNKRRNKQQNADTQQTQQDNTGAVQQTDEQPVKPRRKKQQDSADSQQIQQDTTGAVQQTDEQPVKPRKKKNQDNAETQQVQQDNTQQTDQEQVKPRKKKQQDNAATDQSQQTDQDLKNAIDKQNKKHRKQDAADTQQPQQDTSGQVQQDDQQQVKPKKKKNQDQAEQPADNSNNATDKVETKKKKQPQADQTDENKAADTTKVDHPVDVKKAKDIAADPSKTTDTVVLPVENGAAVLDSDKDADNHGTDRNRRKREREEVKPVRVPKSDQDAQAGFKGDKTVIKVEPVLEIKGEHIPGFKGYDDVGGRRVDDKGTRVVINIGGQIVIRSDDDRRISGGTPIRYERLPNNQVREIIIQPNGDRVVTVRNRYGEIVRRSRIDRSDREVVIFYSPDLERGRDRLFMRDAGGDLPPMRLQIPVKDYIIDVSSDRNRNYEKFLDQPPVEPVERVYSVDEVKNSARIRDKMRRIDLDTITFDTGSSDISMGQASSLKQIGAALKQILDNDPGETFLIEGHTDAVGSDESNLVLSDSRAESVANVLSEVFDIPAENLVTQGYGERFLKIDTDEPERANRRVTIRRITPLVRPLASAE